MAIDWKARLAAEQAKLDEVQLSKDDLEEIDARSAIDRVREQRLDRVRTARDLDLARRLEAARAQLGEDARIRPIAIPEHPHTFLIQDPGREAYRQWEKDVAQVALGKSKIERADVTRAYAAKAVYDWNGVTDFSAINDKTKTTYGAELVKLLSDFPAIATRIQNEATDLAGLAQEERKS